MCCLSFYSECDSNQSVNLFIKPLILIILFKYKKKREKKILIKMSIFNDTDRMDGR